MKPEDFQKILNFDALSEAEKITGKSYKEDQDTSNLGMFLHMKMGEEKKRLLIGRSDTHFNMTEAESLQIFKMNGFKIVLQEPFINQDGIEERFYVLFDYENSILLSFDTFTWKDDGSWAKSGKTVPPPAFNGGHVYFNYAFRNNPKVSLSGGCVCANFGKKRELLYLDKEENMYFVPKNCRTPNWDLHNQTFEEYKEICNPYKERYTKWVEDNQLYEIWTGYLHPTEGLIFNLNQLKENGFFIKEWLECPFIWFLNYMDSKKEGYDYKQINKDRIAKLPAEIQKIINYTES